MIFIVLIFLKSQFCFGQEAQQPAKNFRSENSWHVQGSWAPFSIFIPYKYGASFGYVANESWTYELDYLRGSLPLKVANYEFASIVDQRYGFIARYFGQRESFHFIFGFVKHSLEAELGASVGASIKLESLGPLFGVANRWQWNSGITVTADWFVLYIPSINKKIEDAAIYRVTNDNDRANLDKAIGFVRDFWIFDILRLNLGYSF